LNAAGIRAEFIKQKWPDLLKMANLGQLQMWSLGNMASSVEGFQFMGLLYGPNSGFSNISRFKLPEFDRLYEQARAMPQGPERTKVIHRMSELISIYAPWKLAAYSYSNIVVQPWVSGYKFNGFNPHPWQYLDVDGSRRGTARG
jgi:ABC-type transport system substrate-binding protein